MKYSKKINENVAGGNASNVAGMGAVATSQPSSTPGDSDGGTVGSGDKAAGTKTTYVKKKIKESDVEDCNEETGEGCEKDVSEMKYIKNIRNWLF